MFRHSSLFTLLDLQSTRIARTAVFTASTPASIALLVSGSRHVGIQKQYSTSNTISATTTAAPSAVGNLPKAPATKNVQGNFKVETYISKINDPWTNLAFEEWLFRNSDPSTYILFLYRNSKSVIIGRNQDIGNTNYSIMMPREVFDRRTNVELICRALHELDIPAFVNERHDIVVDGKKIAFKLIQHRSYHHGTMLIDTDLSSLGQYLKVDRSSLVTKGVASVRSPVTRLREHSFTIDHLSFCEATRAEFLKRYAFDSWRQNMEGNSIVVDDKMIDGMEGVKAIRDDMKTWEWMYGQTPEFSYQLKKAFPWGNVNVTIKSKEGLITQVDIDSIDESINAPSLPLTALGIGMEGQKYGAEGLDLAVQRIKDEAPEVLAPLGGAQKVMDVVRWLKEEL
ncbi:Biotin/lipoate A/B protein ligase [Linnemannia zychae]|nr:Biotin/lipoate A/B protein ligase [Linnemannia zychae]